MKALYNLFVHLLISAMKIGAVFNYKLKKGLAGRRQSCDIVKAKFSPEDRVIWMHAASLGEYEQGLPVLEKLKDQFPDRKILITFFSPSGYDNVIHKHHMADAICYLPFDTERWVNVFTSSFRTDIFFTVKYDYWYNLLLHLKDQGAQIYVISALFYEKQVFFKPYGGWFVQQLRETVSWFFHQTRNSYGLAKTIRIDHSSIAGDTRFDRVRQRKTSDNHVPYIAEFKQNKKLIVFGSSWQPEEQIALTVSRNSPGTKIIIAPHDLKRTEQLKQTFPQALLYSECDGSVDVIAASVLIIDCIGLLSKLYSYADLAVVGGGFHSKGLHNILEAATFGIPVFFGNHYSKNPEADQLIAQNGGKSFSEQLYASDYLLKILKDEILMSKMGGQAGQFVDLQPNATGIIMKKILSQMPPSERK
ncbi:MAG: 3-deoxy-D-manno-octulosonic acid transferase [Weeksellaceae bacterium]|nr:3-deoxy-D-manno-octulosonic acid transferase [Weeksellaceae bacterium]